MYYHNATDSILMDSVEMPEMNLSFDEPDVISFLVTSGFACSVTTFLMAKLQLFPSI